MSLEPREDKLNWQQMPGEPAKAYAAARAYFGLGPERSLLKAAEKLARTWPRPGPAGFRASGARFQLQTWSTKFRWPARAETFDEYLERERQRIFENAAKAAAQVWLERELAARQAKYELGQACLAKTTKMLEFPLATVTTDGRVMPDGTIRNTTVVKPGRWSFDTAARVGLIGTKLVDDAVRNTGGTNAGGDLIQEEFVLDDAK